MGHDQHAQTFSVQSVIWHVTSLNGQPSMTKCSIVLWNTLIQPCRIDILDTFHKQTLSTSFNPSCTQMRHLLMISSRQSQPQVRSL